MLDLVTFGDKRLYVKSEEIKNIDGSITQLVNDMFDAMYFYNGIGLSAVQVGVLKRLFIVDIPKIKNGKFVAINPIIKDLAVNVRIYNEGCLSLPGINSDVGRPDTVVLEYTDLKGDKKRIDASGLLATCIQHEFDHLEGVLFIDRLPPDEKISKIGEYRKAIS